MTTADWILRRFSEVIPHGLTSEELTAVGAWLSRLAADPAACGILLPSDHLGTTYPDEHEDYEAGFENLWDAQIPGTEWHCTYQVIAAERTVVCWAFNKPPSTY